MDYFTFVCLLAFFACPSFGNDDPLEVRFENNTKIDVMEGADMIHFRCHLNRGPVFALNNKVEMIHVDPVSSQETIISSSGTLTEGSPEFYEIKLYTDVNNLLVIDFTILKVRREDDGKYLCKTSTGAGEKGMDEREITVHRPLDNLKLIFGDYEPVTESLSDSLEIDAGKYKVSCVAEGSNPGTKDVHAFLHGEMIKHDKAVVTAMEGPVRKYRTTLNGEVDIMIKNSGQEIQCQASDSTGTSLSTKLTISVNIYDPVVHCNDSEAYHGQANPILYCTVNYTGIEVNGFSYQMGDTGEIFRPGDNNAKNIKVNVDNVSEGIAVVSLDLHKAELGYLDKHYYLLIGTKGGHTSKASVRLSRIDGGMEGNNGNGAVKTTTAGLLYILICVLLWSL